MDEYINAFQYREKKADEVRAEIAAEKARIAEEQARIEAEKNKPWYEKAWEGTKVFAGEVSSYNDTVRATTGVDPVTGRKLSEAERVAAGAMAAAGFIPVVGWAGRAIKGGAAIVKTAKTMNAATHSLDAYKTTKGMEILSKTEKGIYGLYTGNSAWEFGTGTDMFGNQLTEEQRMNALWGGLTMGAAGGAAHIIDKGGLRKLADKAPYSTAYAKDYVAKAQNNMKQIGKQVGTKAHQFIKETPGADKRALAATGRELAKVDIPAVVVREVVTTNGDKVKTLGMESRKLGDVVGGGTGAKGTGNASNKINFGEQYTKVNRKKALKPNIEYKTKEGYHYKTDSEGRISNVEATLQLGKADRNNYAQRTVGREDRLPNDDGGHLIANIFRGSGEIDNLVPMNATLNRKEYKALETSWKKALEAGKEVIVKVKPIYVGNSSRPNEFKISYTIDGKKYSDRLTNYSGGK
ncbi:DNA/RNA non-specific endonuclease [Metabacillus sp. 84]|uniref:DNA/RNA non-specific endonuclease n=1 Tax=Metabacillus sp. 84 TaxID=3404705 RepID=UPI003CF3EE7A